MDNTPGPQNGTTAPAVTSDQPVRSGPAGRMTSWRSSTPETMGQIFMQLM